MFLKNFSLPSNAFCLRGEPERGGKWHASTSLFSHLTSFPHPFPPKKAFGEKGD
jgi:hypothetical protein